MVPPAAEKRGIKAVGIEPDIAVASIVGTTNVRIGFPNALEPEERFDAVTFNYERAGVPARSEFCGLHIGHGMLLSVNTPNRPGVNDLDGDRHAKGAQ